MDIFFDDGVIAVADDEEGGGNTGRLPKGGDLVGLALFDKAGEFGAV